ncbi:ATP-binding cassette, subfamily B [Thalassovita taeanensis]|uniref:ATP-binding cassette, subfamily B n=1 Tax=Thalassovita taeanensis TaxID=657014 RepID=A0A1H9FEC7_9RHOB|nr:ABC transporter ATP-binding protein [Thalassovita taeanensis]SEQ36274.1 ATP-binding cassette, subfamily B [Thalassovita taeanensis]
MSTREVPSTRLMGWLWSNYLSKHLWLLLAALFFMALEGSMLGALSWIMRPMFDQVFIEGQKTAIWWVGGAIMAIFVIRAVASVGQKALLSLISQRSAADMRTGMLDHLMRLDGSFHQTHPPGFLIQRVQADVESVGQVWNAVITGAGRDAISLLILMGVAISVDWQWTLVACIGTPIMVLPSAVVQKFVRRRAREARDLGARLATRLDEVFHGIVPVKLNRLEQYQSDRYRALTNDLVRAEVRAKLGAAAIPGLIDIMAGVGFLGVLVFGGAEIIAGEKTIGQFMTFFTAIGFAFEPLRRLGSVTGVWQNAAAAIERIKELLDTQPLLTSPARPKPAPLGTPEVRLSDVQLSYGDTTVLSGATLTAPAGKTTALVGASGAGKSTIFNLLTRLVDPQSGKVLIGGIEAREMSLVDLRGLFSVVSQDAALFDESLRENILLGRTDVSEAQLKSVLEAAHVADFLPKLSRGLETPVGPRGSSLSGGQRQRVAIARALLRNTPILLLDEATSALDAQSEQVVQDALDKLSKGRTTLVIAHRLSTVRNADKIVVMDRGRVVDEGTHDELLARGGIYAELHQLQFRSDGPSADKLAQARLGRPRTGSGSGSTGSDSPAAPNLLGRIARRLFGQ